MLFAACVAMLASCSNDEDFAPQQSALPEDGVIRISASVNQLVASRADADAYTGNDLGLYIRPSVAGSWEYNATTNKYTYPNTKFAKIGEEWLQNTYSSMLWKGDVDYEYYAYAPYNDNISDGKIPFDLDGQSSKTDLQTDLLWASATGTASSLLKGQNELNIQLEHAFCKVAVEISLADEFYQNDVADNPITNISISSSSVKGYLDLFKGNVYVNSENVEDKYNPSEGILSFVISDGKNTAGGTSTDGTYKSSEIYYAPREEDFVMKITTNIGNRTYTYAHGSTYTFERGKTYVIRLKMGKNVARMGKSLQLRGMTVAPEVLKPNKPETSSPLSLIETRFVLCPNLKLPSRTGD